MESLQEEDTKSNDNLKFKKQMMDSQSEVVL